MKLSECQQSKETDQFFMSQVLALSEQAVVNGLFPTAAILVDENGSVLGSGQNQEKTSGVPLDHGEIVAIRNACDAHGAEALKGATIYTNCEPCPMCLGAIYWAQIGRIVYSVSVEQTHQVSFDDLDFYADFSRDRVERHVPSDQVLPEEGFTLLQAWHQTSSE